MQLLAASLNTAKGAARDIPQDAINQLLWKMERHVPDIYSAVPGMTRPL